ncbi:MAG TPA: LamG-like jellyroll fold domain-containing protein, partial [Candidatus Polarisedimenticolaceae bacterium]|nr:LamG-like jellyroll fold domain-containing protein [Candidatus Polarisedimenticolaceae bacterium]
MGIQQTKLASRPGPLSALAVLALVAAGAVGADEPCRRLPRGIVGWWPGEASADDRTLAAQHGLVVNGVAFGAGVIGEAFELDGVNDRIDVPDAPHLRPERFTLAAWVRVDVVTEWACILCKQYGGGNADSLSLWLNFGVLQGGMFGFGEAIAPAPFPVGRIVHAAVTYDGANIRLYQDGELVAAVNGPASAVPYDSNQLIIGAEDNGAGAYTAHFSGMIDEPQIFGRALSSCEIRSLLAARTGGHCAGDSDGDLLPDFQDNCPGLSNAGQIDGDADGAGDACDCSPADPGVHSLDETFELEFTGDSLPDWCGDPSFTGNDTQYDVIRGDLADLPVTGGGAVCRSACAAPLPGMLGWWTGDGGGTDLAGGHDGTLENGAGHSPGWTRDAFSLDGSNDRVRTGNVMLPEVFSVAVWVNSARANQTAYRRIVETSFSTHFALTTDAGGTGYKLIVRSPSQP